MRGRKKPLPSATPLPFKRRGEKKTNRGKNPYSRSHQRKGKRVGKRNRHPEKKVKGEKTHPHRKLGGGGRKKGLFCPKKEGEGREKNEGGKGPRQGVFSGHNGVQSSRRHVLPNTPGGGGRKKKNLSEKMDGVPQTSPPTMV